MISQVADANVSMEANSEANEEMSLVDILRARENGADFRTAAAMFKSGVDHFEAKGHNLYRRMLLEPSDAEALVHYPREASELRISPGGTVGLLLTTIMRFLKPVGTPRPATTNP